jgi:uncharacterized protein YdeI (YjbR/CyaY-like superfamily)
VRTHAHEPVPVTGPRFFRTGADFRAWLEKNHATKTELLVGFHKVGSGKPSMTWPQSVDAALAFGWIDGVRRSIDDTAYTIRFTPRKAKSIWSAVNVARVAALTKDGLMHAAGLAAFALRTPERTGVYSFERNAEAKLTKDEERTLRASAKAAAYFDAQAPWYRRTALHWVVSAKRDATRASRLSELIACCAAGRPIKQLDRSRLPSAKKR